MLLTTCSPCPISSHDKISIKPNHQASVGFVNSTESNANSSRQAYAISCWVTAKVETTPAEALQKQQRGWQVAHQAAQILKTRWGASKVVLFGSMLEAERVHDRSDIDLAVWDLPTNDYFRALAELLDIDPEFSIDLVEVENAKLHIRQAIQAGIDL